MAKPFDVTTKQLIELRPADWPRYLGLPAGPVEVVDADLATVTTEADRVLKVGGAKPYLLHVEFNSAPDDIAERTLRYNALLWYAHKLPVVSVVVLLRPAAERRSQKLTGSIEVFGPNAEPVVHFRYRVIRLWEMEAESLLQSGLSMLPFALLGRVTRAGLPGVVRRIQARIQAEASNQEARELWSAAYLLLGLRYPSSFINELLKGVRQLKESTTYQAILAEGRVEGRLEGELSEARRMLVTIGRGRLGMPSAEIQQRIDAIVSRERLETLGERLFACESWEDLLNS